MRILIVGGAGYVGSHTTEEALRRGHKVVVVDNYSNSSERNLLQIQKKYEDLVFMEMDVDKFSKLNEIEYDAIIYLAALKSVTQGQRIPVRYIETNISKMIPLFEYAKDRDIPFVFSSSAAVYGNITREEPYQVGDRVCPETVYGMTKALGEFIIRDYSKSVILRYFNVAGAGEGIGEEYGRLGNFIPRIYQQEDLNLRKTVDGLYPIRDYIHVLDVANINVDSAEGKIKGTHNVASGVGTDIKQLVDMVGRKDYSEEILGGEEPVKLIGLSDLELEHDINDIIESSTNWYGVELIR